MKGIPETRRAH